MAFVKLKEIVFSERYIYNDITFLISNNFENISNPNKTVENIVDEMPNILSSNIKCVSFLSKSLEISYYWSFVFSVNSFTHFATASSDGTISFYQSCNDLNWYIKDTMYHEAAHLLDYKINRSSSEQWINASKQDVSYPSDYAQSNQKENWAESVAYYYADPIKFKKEFPNRTIIIEEILEINSKENFELAKNN